MSIFDLSLIVIMLGFIVNGLFKGIIKMVGSILALFVGIFIASRFYVIFYDWFSAFISGSENVLKIISYVVILLVASKLVELIFVLIEKIFKIAAFIPGSRLINNVLGAAFGLLLGSLLLGTLLYVMSHYLDIGGNVSNLITNSQIAPLLLNLNKIIIPLLPESLKAVKSLL